MASPLNLGALLQAVTQVTQATKPSGQGANINPAILGRVLSGRGASTGGFVPSQAATSTATVPSSAVAATTGTTPAPNVNPNTGVPQAPAGASLLERLKFNFQNDPALAKALQVGGLKLLGGGSKSFARNVSNAGLSGLQTLENQRGIQRKNVQQQKVNKIASGTLAEETRKNKAAETGRAGDRAVRAASDTARTRVLRRQAAAAERRAAAAETQASKQTDQQFLVDAIAQDLVDNPKATNPNTGKRFKDVAEARAEAIRKSKTMTRAELVQFRLTQLGKNTIGGVPTKEAVAETTAAANAEFEARENAGVASIPKQDLGTLTALGLEKAVNGVPGKDGKLWFITKLEEAGQTVVLQNAAGDERRLNVDELKRDIGAAPAVSAPVPQTRSQRETAATIESAKKVGGGILEAFGRVGVSPGGNPRLMDVLNETP